VLRKLTTKILHFAFFSSHRIKLHLVANSSPRRQSGLCLVCYRAKKQ